MDIAFFGELEEESGRNFSEEQRQRIVAEIRRYRLYREWNETRSPKVKARLRSLQKGLALVRGALQSMPPAEYLSLFYDEVTAMAMFIDGVASGDCKADDLIKTLPEELANLQMNAEKRIEGLYRPPDAGRPPDMHNYLLCWNLARMFEEDEFGVAEVHDPREEETRFASFLAVIWTGLPQDCRPKNAEALIEAARRALGSKFKENRTQDTSPMAHWLKQRDRRDERRKRAKAKTTAASQLP
jgi:hypothetical protein